MEVVERHDQYKRKPNDGRAARHEVSVKIRKEKREQDVMARRVRRSDDDVMWTEGEADGTGLVKFESIPDVEMSDEQFQVALLGKRKLIIDRACELLLTNERNPAKVLQGTVALRHALSASDDLHSMLDITLMHGQTALQYLTMLTKSTIHPFPGFDRNDDLVFEIMWVFTNLLSGTMEQTVLAVSSGMCDSIVYQGVNNPSMNVKEQAFWALGNLVMDKFGYRYIDSLIVQSGILEHYLHTLLLPESTLPFEQLRSMTWSLTAFTGDYTKLPSAGIDAILVTIGRVLVERVFVHDQIPFHGKTYAHGGQPSETGLGIVHHLTLVLKHLTLNGSPVRDRVVHYDFAPLLLTILDHYVIRRAVEIEKSDVFIAVLSVFTNVAAGSTSHVDYLVNSGTVASFKAFLLAFKPRGAAAKETFHLLSNVVADLREHAEMLFRVDPSTGLLNQGDTDVLTHLLSELEFGNERVRLEATWVLHNMFGQCPDFVQYLALHRRDVCRVFAANLKAKDFGLVSITLEVVEEMMMITSSCEDRCTFNHLLDALEEQRVNEIAGQVVAGSPNMTREENLAEKIVSYFDSRDDEAMFN